jgi:hypothetical protein
MSITEMSFATLRGLFLKPLGTLRPEESGP